MTMTRRGRNYVLSLTIKEEKRREKREEGKGGGEEAKLCLFSRWEIGGLGDGRWGMGDGG